MARRLLRVLPYNGNRDYQYYFDRLKVNGKRRRLFFTSEAEAKEELKKWDKAGPKRRRRRTGNFAGIANPGLKMREEARTVRGNPVNR
jgi:hypothetical protein